jgi:hypothetical protein
VNPEHLYLGTDAENIRYRSDCGRVARISGEARYWNAKLTNDKVREIKKRLAKGIKKAVLAREFGVSPAAIRFIANGTTWKDVG